MKKKTEKIEYNEIFISNGVNGTNVKNSTEYDIIITTEKNVITVNKDTIHKFNKTLDITKMKIEFDHSNSGSDT